MMTSFDLDNFDLGSPNLHLKEFLYEPTYPLNFVFLAFMGAEIAGGSRFCPPSRARNSQTLSRKRVNPIHNAKMFCDEADNSSVAESVSVYSGLGGERSALYIFLVLFLIPIFAYMVLVL